MNFVALRMLTGDRAKYLGLIFAIAFCTFLLENQTSIFASILKRTGSQILDVTDANVWVMDGKTEYFEQTKALKDTDLTRVRGVNGVEWAVKLFKGYPVAHIVGNSSVPRRFRKPLQDSRAGCQHHRAIRLRARCLGDVFWKS